MAMNGMERLLVDDLGDLMNRLGETIPQGAVENIRRETPRLLARLDQIEAHLAAEYTALTEAYGNWKQTLQDLENVWALALWRSTAEGAPEEASRIAA
jgi:hypothetical protein